MDSDDDAPLVAWYEPKQTETPPPSPPKPSTIRRAPSPLSDVPYWGYLEPVDPKCRYKDWYFFTDQPVYTLGAGEDVDLRVIGTSISAEHHCTIVWDGTDTPYAVHVVDYADQTWGAWGGTFINDVRLLPGILSLLRHGDRITFLGEEPMATNENLRSSYLETGFTWVQCNRRGWRNTPIGLSKSKKQQA
ncbi:hypothetical protein IEO21_06163 [Rhodonia placenta]|uniref:FHA domain-containing protein n=1 Tax=Rhodonia placenta TaxID=104341 RepID=A0A8H7P0L5_9APHY|nr:hypothetical protein IEO21_06163 [Postia placenta]